MINKEIEFLRSCVKANNETKNDLEKVIRSVETDNEVIRDRIHELQSKCKHEYKGKPNLMGKGLCVICGASDY